MRSTIVAALVLAVAACGGDPAATVTSSGEITQPVLDGCPATLEATNGQRCRGERAVCTIPIACTPLDQQATCICNNGRFGCSDGVGKVPAGAAPRCVQMEAASTETCAPTLEEALGSSCETLGHSCAYLGVTCPERPVQNLDTCTCLRDGTTGALVMKCHVGQCNPLYGGPSAPPH
jgi:hypothetical protein